MWGSVTPNTADECIWANTPFNGGSSSFDSTYFNLVKDDVCPNGILAKKYDAVAQIMGGNWRMPTKAEFDELLSGTTNEWTRVNGVNGYKFTSKKEGFQNNSIFVPAAGYCSGGSLDYVGYYGNVWTSSLDPSYNDYAYTLFFESSFINADDYDYYGFSYRCNGLPVRGVCE